LGTRELGRPDVLLDQTLEEFGAQTVSLDVTAKADDTRQGVRLEPASATGGRGTTACPMLIESSCVERRVLP
jgi:hypothetical protein